MFTTLAVAVALSLAPAQKDTLQLTNVRMTIGELGPTRKVAPLLPGDIPWFAYDIEGLTIEPDGTAKYTMAMEVNDTAGKLIFKQDPREEIISVPLRGNKLPARAFITIGLDQPAGKYSCKITVADPKTKATNSLTVPFEVAKAEFGIVAVTACHDPRGAINAPTTGVVGQTVYILYTIASFQRDPKTKQPNVELLFEILDDQGKPTLGQPRKTIQDSGVDEKDGAFAMRDPLFMSRTGKFTVRITATDKVAGKKATYELPVTVLPSN